MFDGCDETIPSLEKKSNRSGPSAAVRAVASLAAGGVPLVGGPVPGWAAGLGEPLPAAAQVIEVVAAQVHGNPGVPVGPVCLEHLVELPARPSSRLPHHTFPFIRDLVTSMTLCAHNMVSWSSSFAKPPICQQTQITTHQIPN
jgi:hypothetical protein